MFLLIPLLLLVQGANCGHFLFWLPMSAKSVKIAAIEPGLALAEKGHQVTIVCPIKAKKEIKGVREIIHPSDLDVLQNAISEKQLVEKAEMPFLTFIEVSMANNRYAFEMQEVKDLLKDEVKVDVVIVLPAFGNEAGYAVAHKKNASLVTMLPAPISVAPVNWAIGDISNPAYIPNPVLGYSYDMTFKERCINTLVTIAICAVGNLYVRPQTEAIIAKYFPGEEIPSLEEMSTNVALHLNHGSPFLGDGLRPVMPKTVMSGLMTCRPGAPLPKDLADFVEGAEHGVIFVSFGSVIKSSMMPEEKRQLLLKVFSMLKQKIIWKWEVDMPDAPPNVLVSSWLPQQDLLAHPKVHLFITHGGAGSAQETICHKTPIVGIPINGDQHTNVAEAVRNGVGLLEDWHSLEADSLLASVQEVLDNPKYKEAVTRLSDLIMDTPQHPLDRSVWWLEYLLRHPHNTGMKSPAVKLPWFKYFLLDVIGFFVLILASILFLLWKLVICCCAKKQKTE